MGYKHLKKMVAFIMVVTLVFTGAKFDFVVELVKDQSQNTQIEIKADVKRESKEEKKPTKVKELENLRTANSSTYLLSDGSKRLELYGTDIRYEENGELIDYDSSLKRVSKKQKTKLEKIATDSKIINQKDVKKYTYVNASGDAKQYFPKNLDENTSILLEKDNYAIAFAPVTESCEITEESVKDSNITYIEKGQHIEYKYTSYPSGVKEEIILNKEPESNCFTFNFNIPGMKLREIEGSKSIQIIDKKTEESVAYISEPNIKDEDGELTYDEVSYEIEEKEDGNYAVNVIVDENFLKSDSTKYPVTIDPNVIWMHTNLESAAVNSMPYSASFNFKNSGTMQVQNKCNTYGPNVGTEQYCYIDTSGISNGSAFVGDAHNLDYTYIENAYLRLCEYEPNGVSTVAGTQTFNAGTVEVRSAEGAWTPDTITWNNHPDIGDKIWAQFQCTGVRMTEHKVDLTEWARAIIHEEIPNNGLVLKAKEKNTGDTFYSGQLSYAYDDNGVFTPTYMSLVIEYREVGRYYGTPGVYSPTGNYSETSEDMTVQTVLGDISLGRTYNSLQGHVASIVGNGFTFNYGMKVLQKRDGKIVVMPNGAHWNFKNEGTEYKASDNQGTLILENNKYKLVTLDMTEYGFDTNGYLEYVKDEYGNQINVSTNAEGKVNKITDDSGTDIKFTYSGELLTKIEEMKGSTVLKAVEYTYSGNNLIKVKYPGGLETHYQYTDGKLTKITDSGADNAGSLKATEITYYTDGAYEGMVNTLTDSVGVQSTYTYDFANYSTTINDSTSSDENIRSFKETYNDSFAIIQVDDLKNQEDSQQIQEIEYGDQEMTDPDRPSSQTDEYGNVTQYEYDDNGNLTKTIYPDSSTEISVYDQDTNDLLKFTDRNGLVTENIYSDGLLVKIVCGGIQTNAYTYYPESTYGICGLVKTETDAHGNVTSYTYDNKGNILTTTQTIDGTNYVTKNTYDDQGWLTKTEDPNGVCTEYVYNAGGTVLLTRVKDGNGSNVQITREVHDVLGRVVQEISPLDYDATKDNLNADIYADKTVGTRTVYDEKGQVISETDQMGNTTSFVYDNEGNIEKEIQPNGSYMSYVYDREGRMIQESFYDSTTDITTLIQVVTYTEGKNEVITKEYLTSGLVATTVEEYDWEGNLMKQTSPNNAVQTNTYEKGLLIREDNGQGNWTEYTYDTWGRVTTENSSFDETGDSKKIYTYDNYGNVITESVKNNAAHQQESFSKKEYAYDSQDNLIKTVYYDGTTIVSCTQSYYSWDGKLLREYKGLAKPITISGLDDIRNPYNQDYSVIKYEYDTMGRLAKKTDALGQTETYGYDKEDRQIFMKDRKGIEHTTVYDRNDNPIKKISGNITKELTYDCMDNLISEKEGAVQTIYTYDGKDNCLSETTGNVIKSYTYNNADMVTGHTITVDGIQKQRITKSYDNMGNLTAVYENGTLKASYTHDSLGQLIKTRNANGTTEENAYNFAGLVTSTINKKGTEVLSQYVYTYYYDGKERSKTDSSGMSTYIYDEIGQLIKEVRNISSGDNTTIEKAESITVESPTEVNISVGGQIKYYSFIPATTDKYTIVSTNNSGDPEGYLYSSNGTLLQENNDGEEGSNFKIEPTLTAGTEYIIAIKENSGKGNCTLMITQNQGNDNTTISNAKMIVEENPISVRTTVANQMRYYSFIPNTTGIYTIASNGFSGNAYAFIYLPERSPLLTDNNGTNNLHCKLKYQFTAGNTYIIAIKASNIGSCMMTILPPESDERTATEYTYDANGNRTKQKVTENGETTDTTYTYDKNDRLLTEQTGTQTAVTYSYDANGNMTSKSDGTVRTFDNLNRMTSYQSGSGTITTYSYYANDMRKSKKVGTDAEITQVWIDNEIALDLNGSTTISSYIHGEKLICGAYGWYLYNAHGDVTALTDSYGEITRDYDYNPFGVQKTSDESDFNPYRYCGEYYDIESGYTYLQARYYDADIGRFVSEDPAGDGNNWYVYCGNDPLNMIDPTGMWSKKTHREITDIALKRVEKLNNMKKLNKSKLKEGCVYQDVHRGEKSIYGTPYKEPDWHGKRDYKALAKELKKKAGDLWEAGKYGKACLYIGMGVHTIQDHQAHTVVLNGKRVNAINVAFGKLNTAGAYVEINGRMVCVAAGAWKLDAGMEAYLDQNFLRNCSQNGVNGNTLGFYFGENIHRITADNVNADFVNGKWVYTQGKSSRYKIAINKTESYLRKFYKRIK